MTKSGVISVLLLASLSARAEFVELTNAKGDACEVELVSVDGSRETVTVKNKSRRLLTVPWAGFSKKSQKLITGFAADKAFTTKSALRLDVELLSKGKETKKEEIKSSTGGATGTRKWITETFVYAMEFDNRSEFDETFVIQYAVFFEQDQIAQKSSSDRKFAYGGGEVKVRAKKSETVNSMDLPMIEVKLPSGWKYTNGGDKSAKGKCKGIWVRMTKKDVNGELICRDCIEPSNLEKAYVMSDKGEITARVK